MEQKGKIGIKDFVAIVVIMIGTKVADDTPAILFESLYNAAWMAPIIDGIIAFLPILLLMHIVLKYEHKSLFEAINHLIGKYLGWVIIFLLWLILFSSLIIDTAIYTNIIDTMYYVTTPTIIIYGVFMMVCTYCARRGFSQIGSAAWLALPYLQISFLVALLLTIGQGNAHFIFPIFGPGELEVIKESSLRLSIYGDFLYLFFLVPFVRNSKDFRRGTWISFILIVFNLVIAMIGYLFLFDYHSAMQLDYPYHEVIRTISIGFLVNLETFFFPFWLIASIIRFAAYLYINGILFGYLFKIKNFEYIIPSLATLIVFIGLLPESPTFTIFKLREGILFLATPVFFFLPCLLWVIAKIKGVFNHD